MDVSIIIPAYNEEKRILNTLEKYSTFFKTIKKNFEIIVVVDGTDKTDEVVKKFSRKNKNIRLIKFEERQGKGGAVIQGMKVSKGKIIGFTDADNATSAEQFWKVSKSLEQGYGCVVGSRKVKGSVLIRKRPFKDSFGSWGWRILVNLLFNLGVKDIQNGLKVFQKDVVDAIVPKMTITGLAFDVEMLWRVKKAGYKIKEVPIVWDNKMEGSISNVTNWPIMLKDILRIRFSKD